MDEAISAAWVDLTVYRIGRRPDPWEWPDWSYAAPDGTFGNRWDDPQGSYRVLYACSQRLGAFVETLARFRPDLQLLAELAAIEGDEDAPPSGIVPRDWLRGRAIGTARLRGRFANVGDAQSLATIREKLAPLAIHYGLAELDASTIRAVAPRAFTQEVSRFVFELRDPEGGFAGVRYASRLGDEFENWAVFEPVGEEELPLGVEGSELIDPDDLDLIRALQLLGLELT